MSTQNGEEGTREKHRLQQELRKQVFGYVVGAISLVAALAWNDAIKTLIDSLFTLSRDSIWAKFIYAGGITFVVILFTVYLGKFFNPPEEK